MQMMLNCLHAANRGQCFRDIWICLAKGHARVWHLRFNVDKCKVMQVGRPVVHEPYVMQEVNRVPYPLQAVDVEKDLSL